MIASYFLTLFNPYGKFHFLFLRFAYFPTARREWDKVWEGGKEFFFWVNSIGTDYAEDILHDGKIMILFSHSTHYISMARSVGRGAAATEKT